MTWDTLKLILGFLTAVVGLLTAIILLLGNLGKLPPGWNRPLKIVWNRLVAPLLKVALVTATLIIPNGLIIGFVLYELATYYFEAGSLDFIITNSSVFLFLVGSQAGLVSLYAFGWAVLIYPRLRRWFAHQASNSRGATNNHDNGHALATNQCDPPEGASAAVQYSGKRGA